MHIKNRIFLVLLLIAGQSACMAFGVIWATDWLWKTFEVVVQDQVNARGQVLAHELALMTTDLQLATIEPGTTDWQRLQDFCKKTKVPHDGFVCVMRANNGAMLCHSHLDEDPGLLRLFPGHGLLMTEDSAAPITMMIAEGSEAGTHLVAGKVELDGQLHVFTGSRLPTFDAVLAVYQSDESIDHFIAATIEPVMQVSYVLMAFTVGLTALITAFLINRYEAGLIEANSKLEKKVSERTRSLVRTRNAVIFGLAKLAESRDTDTGEHLERIRAYVTILATELAKTNMEIDHHFVADLAVASSLHDIGKVGVPDAVLLKPGKLTPTERKAMEMHTTLGSECLAAIQKHLEEDDFLELAQEIAASHHEQWDGSGYPKGLQGKNIPLGARIVALADVYDALTTSRPYKGPVSHQETLEWIASRYGTHFDPAVVEAFVAREKDFLRVNKSFTEHADERETKTTDLAIPKPDLTEKFLVAE